MAAAVETAAARIGAALSDAQYFESSMVPEDDIRRQLDSTSVKEKLDAMKRVVALISLGRDASSFFPDVVKNVVTSSLEIKKLVYLYLVHYAEEQPDLALLSINSFQKDLSDPNQLIRCLSLRVLSSIRVKVILQIVILAISKSSKDSSPYVRKAAAHAIAKVCELDPASFESLEESLQTLLQDRSPIVLGSAITTLEDVASDRYDLVHPQYRRICRLLTDMDAWGQISCINMLVRYVRLHFPNPYMDNSAESSNVTSSERWSSSRPNGSNAVISDSDQDTQSRNEQEESCQNGFYKQKLHRDIELLLRAVEPLLLASNSSVVLTCVSLYYHVGSRKNFLTMALPAIIKLLMLDDERTVAALKTILMIAPEYSEYLLEHLSLFYLSADDPEHVRELKLKILLIIVQKSSIAKNTTRLRALLLELRYYLLSTDRKAASCAARAIGILATLHPPSVRPIVQLLASTATKSSQGAVTSEVVAVLTRLLRRHPEAQKLALPQLVRMLLTSDTPQAPSARASIVYLLSEFHHGVPGVGPEALRRLAKSFPDEHRSVKVMTINLAAKLYCFAKKNAASENGDVSSVVLLRKLLQYVTAMGVVDVDYDLRDYARLIQASLLSDPEMPALAEAVVEAFVTRKPAEATDTLEDYRDGVVENTILGSMHHIVDRKLPGYKSLPPWSTEIIAEEQRTEPEGGSQGVNRDLASLSSVDYHQGRDAIEKSVWTRKVDNLYNENERGLTSQRPVPVPVDLDAFYDSVDGSDTSGSYETESDDKYSSSEEESDEEASVGNNQDRSKKDSKEASLLDLDNLLGGKSRISTNAIKEDRPGKTANTSSMAENGQVEKDDWVASLSRMHLTPTKSSKLSWRRALESWNGNGLQVDYVFQRAHIQGSGDSTALKLGLKNSTKAPIRKTLSSSSEDVHFHDSPEVSLNVEEVKELEIHVALHGLAKPIQFECEDGVSFKVKPEAGEAIRPYQGLTPSEYNTYEKQLHGMLICTTNISVPERGIARVREVITQHAFVTEVVGRIEEKVRLLGTWAGFLPRETRVPVLLKVLDGNEGAESNELTLWVGCEDALFGGNFVRWLKEKVTMEGS